MKFLFLTALFFMALLQANAQDEAAYYYNKVPYRFSSNMHVLDSNTIIIPVVAPPEDKFSKVKISRFDDFDYRNIVFLNYRTDSYRMLFSDSIQLIMLVYKKSSEYSGPESGTDFFYGGHLLFKVINSDYNKDGRLDSNDPVYLYASEPDGSGLRQITPDRYSVTSFNNFESKGFLLVTMKEDSNLDGIFDYRDCEVMYKVQLQDFDKSGFIQGLKINCGNTR